MVGAVLLPVLTALALVPFRGSFANTSAALVLVLAVVAIAANGYRRAGVVAALSAGASFDFFLTRPYEQFTITRAADVETAGLLLIVGVGVTELAVRGRRQHLLASRDAGYLAGIRAAGEMMAGGGSPDALIEEVSDQITRALALRRCRFQPGSPDWADHLGSSAMGRCCGTAWSGTSTGWLFPWPIVAPR